MHGMEAKQASWHNLVLTHAILITVSSSTLGLHSVIEIVIYRAGRIIFNDTIWQTARQRLPARRSRVLRNPLKSIDQ